MRTVIKLIPNSGPSTFTFDKMADIPYSSLKIKSKLDHILENSIESKLHFDTSSNNLLIDKDCFIQNSNYTKTALESIIENQEYYNVSINQNCSSIFKKLLDYVNTIEIGTDNIYVYNAEHETFKILDITIDILDLLSGF